MDTNHNTNAGTYTGSDYRHDSHEAGSTHSTDSTDSTGRVDSAAVVSVVIEVPAGAQDLLATVLGVAASYATAAANNHRLRSQDAHTRRYDWHTVASALSRAGYAAKATPDPAQETAPGTGGAGQGSAEL